MKTIKSLLFVAATIVAAICEGSIAWQVRVQDEFGEKPEYRSFVGYFVPTYESYNGQIIDMENFLTMLRYGDRSGVREYIYGEAYVTTGKGSYGIISSGPILDYTPAPEQTVNAFAVVFDSTSIDTATKFAVTKELYNKYVSDITTTFSFSNIESSSWETIGSATSGYEYLGGTWYYSANGDDTLTITSVEPGSSMALTIPDAIDGCPVTVVGDNAFDNCITITNVVIPSSITSIGDSAFRGCSGLRSVTITNSVMNIGSYAFSDCRGLTSVTIPDSVTSIGSYAFSGCSGLTSVTIPNSVTSIGSYVFSCSGLTSVTIPDSVTSIGSYVFSSCGKLASVTIPNSVTSIGSYAFYKCSGLKSVTIPDSVTSIGSYVFSSCGGLTSVTIPNSVTNIGDHAFSYCSGLTSVTIPDSVTSIGSYVFSSCRGLKSVTIPNSVTSISDSAFYGCTNVCEATVPGRKCGIPFDYVTNLVISAGTTNIGEWAFYGCSGLTSVTIPDSVTSIGLCAFAGCSGLTSVTIPDSVTSIGNGAFDGCSGLTSVTIPDSVTSIGDYAFSGCSGLADINGFVIVRNTIYSYHGSGGDIVVPDSVTNIGDYAFSGCSGLTSVTIPDSVTSIEFGAFYDCSGLTSVTIPDSVTNIVDHAFSGCSGLTSVTFEGDAPVLGNFVFYGVSADCTVYVSCDSKGWGVDIPGEWNGLPIEYFDGEPEPPEPPEPEIHTVVFDCGEHGKGFVDGELVGGAIEQMVPDGEPVDPPVVVPDEGWLFFDWVGEFDVGEPITCDTGFVAMYVEEPMPPTVDLNYAIESLYIKQGDLRDGNLEIHVAFNLREGFDWLDVADALQNQCDIRVLSGHSYNDPAWCEDCGESQSLVFNNDSETLIATVALPIASRRYYKIVVDDMVDGVFSTDIGMLAYRDGEYVFVTGEDLFEIAEPTKFVGVEDWNYMLPLTVSTADCVRFDYDLDEINSMLWDYTRRDREYSEPFYAVVVNEDLGIEHIAKVNIETLLSDWVSDTIPNAGYFDWDVYYSTVFPGGRYMVGFTTIP